MVCNLKTNDHRYLEFSPKMGVIDGFNRGGYRVHRLPITLAGYRLLQQTRVHCKSELRRLSRSAVFEPRSLDRSSRRHALDVRRSKPMAPIELDKHVNSSKYKETRKLFRKNARLLERGSQRATMTLEL